MSIAIVKVIKSTTAMRLQDNEAWETVEQKLVDEGLHRYLTLEQHAEIVNSLAIVGRGSDDLIDTIETTIIKHRKGLTPNTQAFTTRGFNQLSEDFEILHTVLQYLHKGIRLKPYTYIYTHQVLLNVMEANGFILEKV